MSNKISVITVVFNDVANIRATMESFFSQTWEDKEYIVIDGGSTDGTADIIKEYSDKLAYWCSEKDNGIYDAMNKGIMHATGDWINVLNSGDLFVAKDTLEKFISIANKNENIDVIYGDGIADYGNKLEIKEATNEIKGLEHQAIYRHGCSFVKTATQKKFMYATEKSSVFGFALDFDVIFRMYKNNCTFKKIDLCIQKYNNEGVSNNRYKSLKYNLRITNQYEKKIRNYAYYAKKILSIYIRSSYFFKFVKGIIFEQILNNILPCIPFWNIRRIYLRSIGINVGKETFISKDTYFMSPRLFSIGDNSDINRECLLDARGGLIIGNNVSISHRVNIVTGSHKINSPNFTEIDKKVTIEDYVWLGIGCTILPGVTIGKGAVVCAGAVVTKNVPPFSIVAGIPAIKINERRKDISYKCKWDTLFT